jgi:CheY-like chemotaxis protein
MPSMDGYETARHLRRLSWGKQARLIALTGWGQQQDRIRTAEAGFDVHLVKPVSESDLFRAIAASETSRAEATPSS